jgi:DNA-binding transcriptional MerR regulator/methylmalonyl-CoA mutase cobalamin-binding subunit
MKRKLSRSGEARHPIKVAARRTGLTPDVIRVWEKRYGAVVPQRTKRGQRLYSDEDVDRLRLLGRVTAAGRRIGDVAQIPQDELEALAREDEAAGGAPPARRGHRNDFANVYLRQAMDAVESLDEHGLDQAITLASIALSPPVLRRHMLFPLLHEIGDRWQEGSLRVVHEHLASALVRSFLGSVRNGHNLPETAPHLVVTTPAGQRHELGALLVAAGASEVGWQATYLGPNLPAEEIAAAIHQKRAKAAALSIVYPFDDPHLHDELRRLHRLIDGTASLFVGGAAASGYAEVLEEIHAVRLDSVGALQERLKALSRVLG